jgi:hypothetical protein
MAASQRLTITEAGTSRVTGLVRMHEPIVEIGGISNTQRMSWSQPAGGIAPLTSFSSLEYFDCPGITTPITVRGGQLEALAATPVDLD